MKETCRHCRSTFTPANNRIGRMLREAESCLNCYSTRNDAPRQRRARFEPEPGAWRDVPMIARRVEREQEAAYV